MFIQTEETPNPATIKFIPGQTILEKGTLDFSSRAEAARAPLADRLFRIPGVIRVFLSGDFVSVSKGDDTDWSMLKPMILTALMEHLSTGQPIVDPALLEQSSAAAPSEDEDEIAIQIRELLDTRVRPMVARDGGDIVFDYFEDGVVYLHMRGACSGCPSSTATLKMGIENMLRHFIPEVNEVRASGDL
ncbi:MAG: NifU family protein [Alphaproteobacteria bacterium]|nr:NifU family protein [Alphaproteobacteria bacterium]